MSSTLSLANKVALVTGGSRGIGRAIALGFAERGAAVVVKYNKSPEAAEEGARRVEVVVDKLPLVTDAEKALEPGSPLVHANGNILHQIHYASGDVEAAFAASSVVVEGVYRPQMMDHAFLETEAGVAFPEEGGGRVVSCGQNAYADQEAVAASLGLPIDRVRMVEPFSGGAFGGKQMSAG